MASGLLSLKWNNHRSTFFHVLSTIRSKESYCDVTLACDGRFYSLHKFVLSTCSEYFEEMFERTQCKHPVIVLKDIKHDDLEALLNYMYVGEVNVVQEKLAGLIKAAECLKIKGLAVPDEDPMESKENLSREQQQQHKRSQRTEDSPRAKRRRRENSTDVSEDVLSPVRSRPTARSRDHQSNSQSTKTNALSNEDHLQNDSREEDMHDTAHEEAENSSINANRQESSNSRINSQSTSHKKEHVPEEVTLDDDGVKAEPIDMENEGDHSEHDHLQDNKDSLHQELGFDASDSMGGDDDNYVDVDPSMLGGQPQSVEDVVAQAMPGSSGFQGNSFPMWEGEGSLSNFPVEGFSGDNSQARQMVSPSTAGEHHLNTKNLIPFLEGQFQRPQYQKGDHKNTLKQHQSQQQSTMDQLSLDLGIPLAPSSSSSSGDGGLSTSSLGYFLTTGGGSSTQSSKGAKEARQCHLCPYQTTDASNFRRHIRMHDGDRPFACTVCPHRCSTKHNLNLHMRTHYAGHEFKCTICGYAGKHRGALEYHMTTHHSSPQ